jgi:excinuclease ABC subunit C
MKFKFISKKDLSLLPKESGVYAFKADKGFLYIGKALNIQERVKNHFQQPNYKDSVFINQINEIGYIKTNSEIEALILEASLIKKYRPKHNVVWRDDKNYFYAAATKEDFPKVIITHQTQNKKLIYVGPFVDGNSLKSTLKTLRKVFPYRSCNRIPKHPCLWHHIKRCPAPCLIDKTTLLKNQKDSLKKQCQNNVKNLLKILQGKKPQVLKSLKTEMKKSSDSRNYERAGEIRDKIGAIEKVISNARIFEPEIKRENIWENNQRALQKVLKIKLNVSRIEAYDISNIQGKTAAGSMVVFKDGLPEKSSYRKFKIRIEEKPNDIAMIKEVLSRRLGHQEWPLPELILIDGGKAQLNVAISAVKSSGKKLFTMALAKKNNELYLENQKNPLLLKKLPREIFNLMLSLRDEAHRFAISYHHKLRRNLLIKR